MPLRNLLAKAGQRTGQVLDGAEGDFVLLTPWLSWACALAANAMAQASAGEQLGES
jgi:hypothetical protein